MRVRWYNGMPIFYLSIGRMRMDPVFEEEQRHLSMTYAKLEDIEREMSALLGETEAEALEANRNMLDDLAVDFGNGVNLETYIELESLHQVIDSYNDILNVRRERLKRARQLLRQPYFAKVTLQFDESKPARDVYIGTVGMTDDARKHFIVDWRSPVAETYYNQDLGPTTYRADGRTIRANLLCRRQFEIRGNVLEAYFDTSVAIQDPLLRAALARHRSDRLGAITATIQKEQNAIVRHDDVPALLVAGVAGSGKTSVLLQRIAYLLYQHREDLRPHDVYLLTPNDVFSRYIANVLPDMGELNPLTSTWETLATTMGAGGRAAGDAGTCSNLERIDEGLEALVIEQRDLCDIEVDGERVLAAGQIFSVLKKHHDRVPAGHRLTALVVDDLLERLEQRAKQRASNEDVQAGIMDLSADDQFRIFGCQVNPQSDEELKSLTQRYLEDRYQKAARAVERGDWLRIDRIGMRLLGLQSLNTSEYLYLKLALCDTAFHRVRYVMVDEVQDYTVDQLMVLAKAFPNAHFLLLGDENQAIKGNTATFDEVCDVFERERGSVNVCKLMTSYRSSPEITALFQSLMPEDDRGRVHSMQDAGEAPRIACYDDRASWTEALGDEVLRAHASRGLSAVVAANKATLKAVREALDGLPVHFLDEEGTLPSEGVAVTTLALAKGLEFDRVIIPDATPDVYDDTALSRHRLYTALSRATKHVSVLAKGALTPLLEQWVEPRYQEGSGDKAST